MNFFFRHEQGADLIFRHFVVRQPLPFSEEEAAVSVLFAVIVWATVGAAADSAFASEALGWAAGALGLRAALLPPNCSGELGYIALSTRFKSFGA